jgi:hypothetical protein
MIEKGMILRCKTTTKNDTFGIVLWEVLDTGLQAPEKGRENEKDGVKVIMLGGSGPSARAGMTVIDSEAHIERDIQAGVTIIVPASQKSVMMGQIQKVAVTSTPKHGGTGVLEL